MTLARSYECVRCGQTVGLSAESFVPDQPAPACGKCKGTLKRVKSDMEEFEERRDFKSDPYHQPSAESIQQPCPFEVRG